MVTNLAPVNVPTSPMLSSPSNISTRWNVADLLVMEEAAALESQTEDEPERSLLDQGLYMMKFLLLKTLNSPLNPQNYSTLPQKPSPTTMAPVQPHLLLLRPLPLLSNRLNTKKKNVRTNQLFIEMTLHLSNNLLSTRIHTKLKQISLLTVKHFLKLETPTQSSTKTKPQARLIPSSSTFYAFLLSFLIFDLLFGIMN